MKTQYYFFYGEHCGACKEIKPLINKFSLSNDVRYLEDNGQNEEIYDSFNIQYLPTLILASEDFSTYSKFEGEKQIKNYLINKI